MYWKRTETSVTDFGSFSVFFKSNAPKCAFGWMFVLFSNKSSFYQHGQHTILDFIKASLGNKLLWLCFNFFFSFFLFILHHRCWNRFTRFQQNDQSETGDAYKFKDSCCKIFVPLVPKSEQRKSKSPPPAPPQHPACDLIPWKLAQGCWICRFLFELIVFFSCPKCVCQTHDYSQPLPLSPLCCSFAKKKQNRFASFMLLFTSNLLKLSHSFIMPRKSSKLVSIVWISLWKVYKIKKKSHLNWIWYKMWLRLLFSYLLNL